MFAQIIIIMNESHEAVCIVLGLEAELLVLHLLVGRDIEGVLVISVGIDVVDRSV